MAATAADGATTAAAAAAPGVGGGGGRMGPSTDSDRQSERIQARRNRIRARMEANKRGEPEREVEDKPLIPAQPEQSIAQLKASRQALESLREQGTDKVTLVRVTADYSESSRRRQRDDAHAELQRQVLAEQEQSQKLFDEVAARWSTSADKTDHVALKAELDDLQGSCQAVIDLKDMLIGDLKVQLKGRDETYVKDLRAHTSDVDTMLRYMEEQTQAMVAEYREQIEGIERTFMAERGDLIKTARQEWDSFMDRRRAAEVDFVERNRPDLQLEQLEQLRAADAEEHHHVKVKLETEIQNLEQQLQTMKATLQMNSEKLDYNYQVLKKRDEENMIMVTQQKRRINRLQDVLNGLKGKLIKTEKQYKDENAVLTEDYSRIAEQFKDLQKKFRHFQGIDAKRYDEVFEMNEETNAALARELLDADRVIFEQQLGLKWVPPAPDAFDSSAEAGRRAAAAAERRMNEAAGKGLLAEGDDVYVTNDTIRRALEMLCDEAGFLLEDKIEKLISPLPKDEQSLVKLDAIFKALGIEDEADIVRLAKHFVQPGSKEQGLIHPNEAMEALRRFAEEHRRIKGIDKPETLASGKTRRPDFWSQLLGVVPREHDDAWNALEDGMEKYAAVLQGRQQAMDTTDALRQQNQELRDLLQHYMSAQINSELAVPPTAVFARQAQAQAQ